MKKSVLVVDDEQGYRDMYVFLLEPLGIKVTCVSDGQQAVQKSKENPYDLIVMDVHMPVLTGPEALKQIKKMRPEQKIVIFSSSSDPNYVFENQAKEEGAIECLFKPVDLEDIKRILKDTIGPLSTSFL